MGLVSPRWRSITDTGHSHFLLHVTLLGIVPVTILKVVGIELTSIGIFEPTSPDDIVIALEDESGTKYRKLVISGGRIIDVGKSVRAEHGGSTCARATGNRGKRPGEPGGNQSSGAFESVGHRAFFPTGACAGPGGQLPVIQLVLAGALMGGEIEAAVREVRARGLLVISLNMAGSVPDAADLVVSDPVQAGVMAVMAVGKVMPSDIRSRRLWMMRWICVYSLSSNAFVPWPSSRRRSHISSHR